MSDYITKGVNEENGVPYLQGNDNIIHVNIDPPVSVDFSTFKNNTSPYIEGDGNVITITIGDDSYAFKDVTTSNGGTTLTFVRLGQETESINIPDVVTSIEKSDRELIVSHASGAQDNVLVPTWGQAVVQDISYLTDATSATVTFLDGEVAQYNITYNADGTINTIEKA